MPENGKEVNLFFESFDVDYNPTNQECVGDFVEVSYGSISQKFCGNTIPGPFKSNSPITVKMFTDSSGRRSGFNAIWLDRKKGQGEVM